MCSWLCVCLSVSVWACGPASVKTCVSCACARFVLIAVTVSSGRSRKTLLSFYRFAGRKHRTACRQPGFPDRVERMEVRLRRRVNPPDIRSAGTDCLCVSISLCVCICACFLSNVETALCLHLADHRKGCRGENGFSSTGSRMEVSGKSQPLRVYRQNGDVAVCILRWHGGIYGRANEKAAI